MFTYEIKTAYFSLRFGLPSTRKQRFLSPKTETFENALQSEAIRTSGLSFSCGRQNGVSSKTMTSQPLSPAATSDVKKMRSPYDAWKDTYMTWNCCEFTQKRMKSSSFLWRCMTTLPKEVKASVYVDGVVSRGNSEWMITLFVHG